MVRVRSMARGDGWAGLGLGSRAVQNACAPYCSLSYYKTFNMGVKLEVLIKDQA